MENLLGSGAQAWPQTSQVQDLYLLLTKIGHIQRSEVLGLHYLILGPGTLLSKVALTFRLLSLLDALVKTLVLPVYLHWTLLRPMTVLFHSTLLPLIDALAPLMYPCWILTMVNFSRAAVLQVLEALRLALPSAKMTVLYMAW